MCRFSICSTIFALGDPFDEFLNGFPPVTREQAVAVIDLAARGLLEGWRQL